MTSEIVSYEAVHGAKTALAYLRSENYSEPALGIGDYVWRGTMNWKGEILEDEGIIVAITISTSSKNSGWRYRVAWQKARSQAWRATPFLEWASQSHLGWYEAENYSLNGSGSICKS